MRASGRDRGGLPKTTRRRAPFLPTHISVVDAFETPVRADEVLTPKEIVTRLKRVRQRNGPDHGARLAIVELEAATRFAVGLLGVLSRMTRVVEDNGTPDQAILNVLRIQRREANPRLIVREWMFLARAIDRHAFVWPEVKMTTPGYEAFVEIVRDSFARAANEVAHAVRDEFATRNSTAAAALKMPFLVEAIRAWRKPRPTRASWKALTACLQGLGELISVPDAATMRREWDRTVKGDRFPLGGS